MTDKPAIVAVFSRARAADLTEAERCDMFDHETAFRSWCRKHGYVPEVRVLPADPEGHAERRRDRRS